MLRILSVSLKFESRIYVHLQTGLFAGIKVFCSLRVLVMLPHLSVLEFLQLLYFQHYVAATIKQNIKMKSDITFIQLLCIAVDPFFRMRTFNHPRLAE